MFLYTVTITGIQPMLHHADSVEWSDAMDEWRSDKDNKKGSKAGDDRSPAWRWLGGLYHDGKQIIIPTENIMRCLMEGGAMVPTGSGRKTFKSQTQSGIQPMAIGWPLLINKSPVPVDEILALNGEPDFAKHKQVAVDHGFSLFVKRAKIPPSKHVRVRARFETWAAIGELAVTDEQITAKVLSDILVMAGRYKGLGDWRPGGKTPGPYGMFEAKISKA